MASALAVATGGVTFEQLCSKRGVELPDFHPGEDATSPWLTATAAFAQGASGRVRVLVGRWPEPASMFVAQSYPLLAANPNVAEIVAIDALSGEERPLAMSR
jgi:hypothetical protein